MNKQYSNLTQKQKDNLHSKCCEGTNEEQEKMIKAYTIVIKEAINKIK